MVVLRPVRDSDLDVLFEHWTDPESNRMAAFTAEDPTDREAFDDRWRRLRAGGGLTALAIEHHGEVVGSISSWDSHGTREVTYWIGREHWGNGIATAALRSLLATVETTRPVQAAVAHDNVGSRRVLEKCGFRRVGRGRGFANGRGEDVDEVLYRLDA